MTSHQIIENLNQKVKERLNQKKSLKASELTDLSLVEVMWLAVYSGNGHAIWKFVKLEQSYAIVSEGKKWTCSDFTIELRTQS